MKNECALRAKLVFILFLIHLTAYNQGIALTGNVTDIKDGHSIGQVQIDVVGKNRSTTTDNFGNYYLPLSNTKLGEIITIRASKKGYRTYPETIAATNLSHQIKLTQDRRNRIKKESDKATNPINQIIEENALTGHFDFDFGKPVYDSSWVTIIFGSWTTRNTVKPISKIWFSGMHLLSFSDGYEPIKFGVKNKKLVISLDVYDLNGNLIVKIDSNYWHRYPNNTGQFNYDKKGFEIFDNSGKIALSIDLVSEDTINIRGYLVYRDHNFLMIGGQQIMINNWGKTQTELNQSEKEELTAIPQLFEYNADPWLHVRKKK